MGDKSVIARRKMQVCAGAIRLNSNKSLDDASERAIVERCRQNDFEAFGRLIDAYQNRVFGFIKRMVPIPEEAADLTQEVFIRAYTNFARFDGRCSIRTWLFRIAYNLCVDRSRRMQHAPQTTDLYPIAGGDEPVEVADHRWEPERVALDVELMQALEDAIGSMSEKLRSVLLLHDREDLSYEEIADVLRLPLGTVKSRLFLARAHLQKNLSVYLKGDAATI